jgi:hypothetical protein
MSERFQRLKRIRDALAARLPLRKLMKVLRPAKARGALLYAMPLTIALKAHLMASGTPAVDAEKAAVRAAVPLLVFGALVTGGLILVRKEMSARKSQEAARAIYRAADHLARRDPDMAGRVLDGALESTELVAIQNMLIEKVQRGELSLEPYQPGSGALTPWQAAGLFRPAFTELMALYIKNGYQKRPLDPDNEIVKVMDQMGKDFMQEGAIAEAEAAEEIVVEKKRRRRKAPSMIHEISLESSTGGRFERDFRVYFKHDRAGGTTWSFHHFIKDTTVDTWIHETAISFFETEKWMDYQFRKFMRKNQFSKDNIKQAAVLFRQQHAAILDTFDQLDLIKIILRRKLDLSGLWGIAPKKKDREHIEVSDSIQNAGKYARGADKILFKANDPEYEDSIQSILMDSADSLNALQGLMENMDLYSRNPRVPVFPEIMPPSNFTIRTVDPEDYDDVIFTPKSEDGAGAQDSWWNVSEGEAWDVDEISPGEPEAELEQLIGAAAQLEDRGEDTLRIRHNIGLATEAIEQGDGQDARRHLDAITREIRGRLYPGTPPPPQAAPLTTCPECKGKLIRDERGETVCESCGLVVDVSKEWD